MPSGPPDGESDAAPRRLPGTGSAFPTRDQLVQAWGDHVIVGLRPKAKALFQAGRFVTVDGDQAVFGLPNETHRGRCEEVRPEVESALSDHFGRPVEIDLVVDPGAAPPVGTTGGPDPSGPPARRAPRAGAVAAAEVDPGGPAQPEDRDGRRREDFDHHELEVAAGFDNSVESRVLQAFPGAEEVG